MNETLSNNPGEEQEGQNPAETLAEMPDFEEHLKELYEREPKELKEVDDQILKDIAEDVGSEEVVFTPFRPEEPVPPPTPEEESEPDTN